MDYEQAKNFLLNTWTAKPRQATHLIKKSNPTLASLLEVRYGKTFSEKCWLFVHEMATPPVCKKCQKQYAKFLDFRRGYTIYCGVQCMSNATEIHNKRKITCIDKYGVEHFSKTSSYKSKFEKTNIERYGVKNPGQIKEKLTLRARKKQETYWENLCKAIKEFTVPEHSFEEYTKVRDDELKWKCTKCDLIFKSHLFGRIPKCPVCYPKPKLGGQSSIEKDILNEIRKFYKGEIVENSRTIISPKELDIYFPKEKFAIEINGIYWHSGEKISPSYHAEKYQYCKKMNIRLLMITDLEWKLNKNLIIEMIKYRLNLCTTEKIFARKTKVKPITTQIAKQFMNRYHLGGFLKGKIYLGLFYDSTLVAVSIFGKHRFNKKSSDTEYELVRFATSKPIAGSLGKMIKYLRQDYNVTKIISYADLRYGSGEVYLKNNFEHIKTTKPGYWYYLEGKLYHRLSWSKKKLMKLGYDSRQTEEQIMKFKGALKIYDCGHNVYEYRI